MVTMTDEQKYSAVLKELGEVLQDKNTTITCQRWQIDQLKEKLATAEAEMADNAKNIAIVTAERDMLQVQKEAAERDLERATEVCQDSKELYLLLDSESIDALREVNAELRKYYDKHGCIMCDDNMGALQDKIKRILPIAGGAA